MVIARHRLSAVALLLLVSVALVACTAGTATSSDTALPTSPVAGDTAQASPAGPAVQNAVAISGFAFSPGSITVPVGTKVTWTNQDSVAHTVVSDDGKTFTSGDVPNGGTYSFTFTTAGTYAYHCSIHPSMKGTVTVTP